MADSDVSKLATEEIVEKICKMMPDHNDPAQKNAIRDHVAERLRREKVTGADLATLAAVRALSAKFEIDDDFTSLITRAATASRNSRSLFQQLLIDMALPKVAFEKCQDEFQQIINSDRLAPEYNVMYEKGDEWLIASGEQREFVFDDGTRVMHGFYVAPGGWYRLGIRPRVPGDAGPDIHKTWHKAYHGTGIANIAKIINEGFKGPKDPGYVMKGGKLGAAGENIVYMSPCLEYVAHWLYSTSKGDEQKAKLDGCGGGDVPAIPSDPWMESGSGWVQFVLELRVKPSSYRLGPTVTEWNGNTLRSPYTYHKTEDGWPHRKVMFDKLCLNQSLEWLVPDAHDNAVVTGVMMRWLDTSPVEHNRRRMEMMTRHVDYDPSDSTGTMRRPRNHGGIEVGTFAAWEYNASAGRCRGGPGTVGDSANTTWVRYDEATSDIIELAYQQYQRIVFIGRLPRLAPEAEQHPYYIDFMDWCDDGEDDREQKPKHHRSGVTGPMQHRADESKNEGNRIRSVRRVPK